MSYDPVTNACAGWAATIGNALQGDPAARASLAEVTGRPDAAHFFHFVDISGPQIVTTLRSMVREPSEWTADKRQQPGDPGYDQFEERVVNLMLAIAERIKRDT